MVPCQAFATADAHVMAAAGDDGRHRAFAGVAAFAHLVMDPRYATRPVAFATALA
jgi:crotonobetainyl-CoA:carnitine CoA-transferase CaiB-like acyl-CoA transferase